MRSQSYLNSTQKLIAAYDGSLPLTAWLKNFFKGHRKYGSKDRKEIAHACYCFFRLGKAFENVDERERILLGLFLGSSSTNLVLEEIKPEWNAQITLSIEQKLELLSAPNEMDVLFPLTDEVSKEINKRKFAESFLIQPTVFLRLRPGQEQKVLSKFDQSETPFSLINDHCIRIAPNIKIEEIIKIDKEAVVQDYSSQRIGEVFENLKSQTSNLKSVWDCCAASGGKSILFHDHFPRAHLTVSDIRESIIINLQKRFRRAEIENYDWFIADLSSENFSFTKKFDVIICDVPCSGSGTWSRTPEQLSFFQKEKINEYAMLQKKIAFNAAKSIKQNGFLIYITCSVFKRENEEVVEHLQNKTSLQLQSTHYFKGYDKKADTLFAAVFML